MTTRGVGRIASLRVGEPGGGGKKGRDPGGNLGVARG